MPSRQSVPRIRIDLPDSSPCSMSPSGTLDIKDVLAQAKLSPKLLAEDFVFGDADDAFYFGDGRLQDLPSFPMGRRPPLFILNSYRARLPFSIRQDAFELGDFCRDEEDACPLLTAPTIPRMKLMIREQLYVQKWVDTLTPDNPPKHIPWTCEKPATKNSWIAEGSIFPADMAKSVKFFAGQRGATQEHLLITDSNRFSNHSRELLAVPEASVPILASTDSRAPAPYPRANSADVDTCRFRGESKTSHTPTRFVRTSQAPSPSAVPPSSPQIGTLPYVPLATRRGKPLSGLKLKGGVIEHLEYPDIPTAFRGSSTVWSPRFETFPVLTITDHDSMLLNLKAKCAALGNGVSAYVQEAQTGLTCTSLSVDEWAFTRGLVSFDNESPEPVDSQLPRECIVDASAFLPDDSSTPAKGVSFTSRLGLVPRLRSAPTLQSDLNRSSDPPGVPLPPRPALISPSTSPHVRGILKKVKSVRFEDAVTKESENQSSPTSPSQASPERSSPLPSTASSERPCTPFQNIAKPSSDPILVKEASQKENLAPRSRLPPKRAKANGKPVPVQPNVGNATEPCKPPLATMSVERPCRNSHMKENARATTVPRAQAKQKGLSLTEVDVRRGIEGTVKNRLSTPLRNIFRLR